MAKPRKTVSVKFILDRANFFLANSESSETEQRIAIANLLEMILDEARAYKGFGHLDSAEVRYDDWQEAWCKHYAIAEIRKANGIVNYAMDQPRWEDYCKDDTRRVYYCARELMES